MSVDFEEYQNRLIAEMKKTYSEAVVDHVLNPRNMGNLLDADGAGQITGPCGDTMQIWLKVKDDVITDAAFMTDGCGTSIASGSMTADMAKRRNVHQAVKIGQRDVLDALGGLPEESQHCALLATNTLREAIKDYIVLKKEPWKKAYRKY